MMKKHLNKEQKSECKKLKKIADSFHVKTFMSQEETDTFESYAAKEGYSGL